jgi:putative effector of murein hydrolase LrgA (UPF0299 family)
MDFALLALAVAALAFILTVLVPIATFLRVRKADYDIRRIDGRLDKLESEMNRFQTAAREAADAGEARPAISAPAPAAVSPVASPLSPIAGPAAATAAAPAGRESLESRIGGRWLLYVGTAVLVLGIGFFVKYAFENDWINQTGRVLIGTAAGLVMIAGGHHFARRGYALYGQIVAGGGFASLYVSVFAALSFYGLIGRPAAFGLMVLITAGAALAAEVYRSQGLAVFAVAGGFLTPFLVGGGQNAQVVLLSYDAMLAAAAMVLAARRGWPALNLVSYAFVLVTFLAWADRFYTPAQWVPTQVFLAIFAVLFTGAGVRTWRSGGVTGDAVGVLLLTAPLVFHAGSVANLQPHWMALLLYLTVAAVVGVAASMKTDRAWLRLAVFALVAPVLWQFIGEHGSPGWRLAPAVVALAIYAMNLLAIAERMARRTGRWFKADVLLFHVNALGLFAGLYAIIDPVATAWTPALALAVAAWHGALTWAWRDTSEEASLNSLAVAFAMLGFAIGLQFDRWWAVVGWGVESAAVVWVGLKTRRDWIRLGGAVLLGWTIVRLVSLGFFTSPAGFSPIFNARVGATLLLVAVCCVLALFHQRYGSAMADRAAPETAALYILANVLAIVLLTTEISFYWQMREDTDAAARLARSASVSVAWAVYGTALIVVGIVRKYAPVRYLAIALLAMTVVKAFLFDLSMLGGIYRIIGFVGLGVFLLIGAWLYQRYRDVIVGRE